MSKAVLLASLVAGLSGCVVTPQATPPSAYGDFTQNLPVAFDRTMADDAVKQLVAVYPPAQTRFDLQQNAPDAFGTVFVEVLRSKGYAISERQPSVPVPAASAASNAASSAVATVGKPLRYILDQADSNLYRVTLLVADQSLTRAYLAAQNGTLYPAGAWVRKE